MVTRDNRTMSMYTLAIRMGVELFGMSNGSRVVGHKSRATSIKPPEIWRVWPKRLKKAPTQKGIMVGVS
jgi:hypothetical protein